MNTTLPVALFDPDPTKRFEATRDLNFEQKKSILADLDPKLAGVHGVANAWIVTVGPNPGARKGNEGKKAGQRDLVLGEVHPRLNEFKSGHPYSPFYDGLFWLLKHSFCLAAILRKSNRDCTAECQCECVDDYLNLTLHMNLDTTCGKSEKDLSVRILSTSATTLTANCRGMPAAGRRCAEREGL